MTQILSGGSANMQTAAPRTSLEVHQESPVGRSIIQMFHQLNDLETALSTLHERMSPVLVAPSPTPTTNSAGNEIQVMSPMGSDMLRLQNKVQQTADKVYDLIHRLSI